MPAAVASLPMLRSHLATPSSISGRPRQVLMPRASRAVATATGRGFGPAGRSAAAMAAPSPSRKLAPTNYYAHHKPACRRASVVARASGELAAAEPSTALLGQPADVVLRELLAGITVALTLIPETLAFALVVGVNPMLGIHTTAVAAVTSAVLGGRPAMLSGAAGALAVVSCALSKSHGVEYLFASVALMGVFQLMTTTLSLGRFAVLIPRSVVLGFVSGLSIVIGRSQLHNFQALSGAALNQFCGLVAAGMIMIEFLPRVLKKLKLPVDIPPSLLAVAILTAVVQGAGLSAVVVNDIATISHLMPSFHVPNVPFTLETLKVIAPYSAIMAAIGLVETVLTISVVDESTGTKGSFNRESFGQGMANFIGGFMSNQGACAMIVPSNLNTSSGGRTRLSSLFCGLAVLSSVFIPGAIGAIPLAGLTAVLLDVCLHTFAWSAWKSVASLPRADVAIMAAVTVITVLYDLATAFFSGVLLAALVFAFQQSTALEVDGGPANYSVKGPLYFGSVDALARGLKAAGLAEGANITVDMSRCKVMDLSAAHGLQEAAGGKTVSLVGLCESSRGLLLECGAMREDGVVLVA